MLWYLLSEILRPVDIGIYSRMVFLIAGKTQVYLNNSEKKRCNEPKIRPVNPDNFIMVERLAEASRHRNSRELLFKNSSPTLTSNLYYDTVRVSQNKGI